MKAEAQIKAIAGACGWKFTPSGQHPGATSIYRPDGALLVHVFEEDLSEYLPGYLSDLNEMTAPMKVLTGHQQDQFAFELWRIIRRDRARSETDVRSIDFAAVNATPSQRAEALLRTLNLWTE